jgi:GlpG protein
LANIAALQLDRDIDLSQFSRYLTQAGVPHRVTEAGEQQIVWVTSEAAKEAVLVAYQHFERGELPTVTIAPKPVSAGRFKALLLRSPMTLTIILANLICFPATIGVEDGVLGEWLRELTLLDFREIGGQTYFADLDYTLNSGQWWRLITPMLLHFGILHIVFNLLWVWEIGRRIEVMCGAGYLLAIVLVSSLTANLTQYFMSGAGLFGGMSGVVFGLLGYAFIWSQLIPRLTLDLPKGLYIFMLAFLVLGFTGAIDMLGLGNLANGAHLGGLLGGVAVGLLAVGLHKLLHQLKQPGR